VSRQSLLEFVIVALGVALGLIWLLPSYNEPIARADAASIEGLRALRIVAPFIVALIVATFFGKVRNWSILDLTLIPLFVIWPQIVWLVCGANYESQQMIVLPLMLSGLTILTLSFWTESAFCSLLIGVGFSAIALISFRIWHFGLESNTYYLRNRMHLGFDHPITSACAVVSSVIAVILCAEKIASRKVRIAILLVVLVANAVLLSKVDSKNTSLFAGMIICLAVARRLVRNTRVWPLIFVVIGVFIVLSGLILLNFETLINLVGSENIQSAGSRLVDSIRVSHFMTIGSVSIWGHQDLHSLRFSVTDSIYTSYWFHFGLVGLTLLITFFTILGFKIAHSSPKSFFQSISFSSILGVSIFFLIDAQGITSANLLVFLLLAMSYRWALQPKSID
jgi:hypothetical protein